MKITLQQLSAAYPVLMNLATQPLPIPTAFKLKGINKKVTEHVVDFDESRLELCKKYGTLEEGASEYQFNGHESEFQKEFIELLAVEVELEAEKLNLRLLSDAKIAANDLMAIEFLLED